MDPFDIVTRYSFITNKLRYCGPHDSYLEFLEYIKTKDKKLISKIKDQIKKFEGLYPYLELIAKKHDLDPFDEKVIEAYWIGNDLLDSFDEKDLQEMIMALTKRGLPKTYAKKLCDGVPKNMVPHHSFNVVYVGVGKVTGSVEFNIKNINNCLIRHGEVINVGKLTVTLKHRPYVFKDNKIVLGKDVIEEFEYLPEFNNLEVEDIVSIHWNFVVDKLNDDQLINLLKWTLRNIDSLNNKLN
jgi:hypothetical protein